ncbi:MAG TPA: molybdopterin-dependent oxidoreductase [Thermoanaerobaculia bacterium]|nr:molybdopterin-dependent oxidoreductase [Thermoanaerobaculia bacterium]
MPKDSALEVLSTAPFKAQSPLGRLVDDTITPLELFYVCTHAAIPAVAEETFRLEVTGVVARPLRLRLADLRANFPEVEVTATLQSAANRRDELARVRPLEGQTPWGASAIGTASWRGISLAALLSGAGPLDGAAHVAFTGLDQCEKDGERFGFGGSIPFWKAMAGDVVLAWEMNGEPLAAEHGYPLRVVVPGWIGARSIKWLSRIEVRREPSDNFQQQRGNKLFPAHVDASSVDWSQGLMLGESSLTSAICEPLDGAELAQGQVRVRGYAVAGGQRTVERVEVSADNGASWTVATLAGEGAPGVWRLWEASLELPAGPHELVCRVWDSAANTQPEDPAHLWNFLGLMNNAWHRVRVWVRE